MKHAHRRQRLHADDRRAALLDAAIGEIARRGTRGMRVEQVARVAGVSAALVYHYFGDRATLLQQALEHIGVRADSYTTPPPGASARGTLETKLLDEIQDDPDVRTNSAAWGELRDTAVFDPALRPTLAALTGRWVEDIALLVKRGHEDGSIDPAVDPEGAGIRLSALVEGISGRWLTGVLDTTSARGHVAAGIAAVLGDATRPKPHS
jgi:AcrR family transcriptional regulator